MEDCAAESFAETRGITNHAAPAQHRVTQVRRDISDPRENVEIGSVFNPVIEAEAAAAVSEESADRRPFEVKAGVAGIETRWTSQKLVSRLTSMNSWVVPVPLAEAKSRLSELIERVSHGEEFVITRHDTEIARLVPVKRAGRGEVVEAIAAMRAGRSRRSASTAELRDWREEGRR